ncbi:hypothetical protein GCM10028777_16210 [Angustibacter speluncae]
MNASRALPQDDDQLLDALRGLWERRDPVPTGLVDRVQFAIWLEDLDTEVEMLALTSEVDVAAGARSTETARTVTFSTDHLSIMITVSERPDGRRRVDGWVSPAASGQVVVRQSDGSNHDAEVDADGRFALDDLVPGLAQLVLRGTGGDAVATPPIEL